MAAGRSSSGSSRSRARVRPTLNIASTRISSPVVKPRVLPTRSSTVAMGVSANQHQPFGDFWYMAPEDDEVGAFLVGLDQLQLVTGDADIGLTGGEHLRDRRCVRAAVQQLDGDAAVGEHAAAVGHVPRRPFDVGDPVERSAHRAGHRCGRRPLWCRRAAGVVAAPSPLAVRRRVGVVIVIAARGEQRRSQDDCSSCDSGGSGQECPSALHVGSPLGGGVLLLW